jgi:nucleosome binding factor SPN SPT16 subunit
VSDDKFVHFGTILCSLGAKYKSYCSNVARTYLVDPKPAQNEVYQLAFDIQQVLITSMRSGVKLSSLYHKAIDMIKSHKPELVEKFTKNCGSGVRYH